MKVKGDNGSKTLNILFGVFIVLNITNTAILLYDRLKNKKEKKENAA